MLKISIPYSFINERKYVIKTILSTFLGLEFHILNNNSKNFYIIEAENKVLTFPDFVLGTPKDHLIKNIPLPSKVSFSQNKYLNDQIPHFWGDGKIDETSNSIHCNIDIFGTIFLFLTRIEEYLCNIRDYHRRFSSDYSFIKKFDLIKVPVVDIYTSLLKKLLQQLHIAKCSDVPYKTIPTHDIDIPFYYPNTLPWLCRRLILNILRDKNLKSPLHTLHAVKKIRNNKIHDPYDTFTELMSISESLDLKSDFYFMSSPKTKYDSGYSINHPSLKNILNAIYRRGHTIGFHPSYFSYNDPIKWKYEYQNLNNTLKKLNIPTAKCGRQHYLRFDVQSTWQIWNENDMAISSTLGFAETAGFRCGTAREFPVYDLVSRRELSLNERPLIFMEGTFQKYTPLPFDEIYDIAIDLKRTIKKYGGNFTILTHNTTISNLSWSGWKECYAQILKFNPLQV